MRHEVRGAVVTGGGSGLGAAFARALAGRGIPVVLADLDGARAEAVAGEVRALGVDAWGLEVDVRDARAMEALRDVAIGKLPALDLWINNAGVAVAGAVGEVPLDDWRWVLDVNLMGVIHGCHAVVPHLRAQGRGVVLNVSSAAGLLATPEMAPYNVAKAGVVSLSETLYGELSPLGLGVTVLCPTFFRTNLLDAARSASPRALRIAGRLMDRSSFTPDDVAEAALRDALAGRLFSVPMSDGRWLWRLRRLLPQGFYDGYRHGVGLVRRLASR
ncbi:MAG: SDR family NAD(P)-dependent oxidoreductase [Alphaproteobacteria bacterium]|nr:SDR family NAD(P)-dependent oxidoreductase [Alphaproteobacteria bacterium]